MERFRSPKGKETKINRSFSKTPRRIAPKEGIYGCQMSRILNTQRQKENIYRKAPKHSR
jgi:hypothetical protein